MTIPLPKALDIHPDELEAIAARWEILITIDGGQGFYFTEQEARKFIAALRYCKIILETA